MKSPTVLTALVCGACLLLANSTAMGGGTTITSPDGGWAASLLMKPAQAFA